MTTTIALAERLAAEYGERIEAAGDGRVRLLPLRGEDGEAALDAVEIAIYGGYEGPLSFAQLAARMPRLGWIHSTGAGIESFASPELAAREVVVTNSSGVYAPAMAEFVVAAMVCVARDLRRLLRQQDARTWLHEPVSGGELYGKRLGIVGYGLTGRYLARICKALGMEVTATRRTPVPATDEPLDRLLPPERLPELLSESDYVVVTASLNSTTRHLLGEAELALLAPGAVVVNVARGGLVDQEALVRALGEGRLRGAVLDVVEPEPLPPESPLWTDPRVILTPHISGGSPEGWDRSLELFCRNLPLYLDGRSERLANLVDLADHL